MRPSSGILKARARQCLKGHYSILISAYLITSLIPSVLTMLFSLGYVEGSTTYLIIQYAADFIISIFSMVLSVGLLKMILNMVRGEKLELGQIFYGFKHHPDRYILSSLLLCIILIAPMIIPGILAVYVLSRPTINIGLLILSILLFIAALIIEIILTLCYTFIFPLLLDSPDKGVITAFKESRYITKGSRGRLFYLILSFIGWSLLGACSLGIGFLWITPYMETTQIYFYLDLIGENPARQPENETEFHSFN